MRFENFRHHHVDRQHDLAPGGLGLVHDFLRGVDQVTLDKAILPTFLLSASRNVLAMAPPMISTSTLLEQIAEQIELGGNLGAADDGRERARRLVEHLFERFQFGLHGAAGISRQQMREPFGRGMRAVRHREGVVDEDIAELGERGAELRIVLLFARMEARVLETKNVAGMHRGDRALGALRPMHSSTKLIGRLMVWASSAATGLSDCFGSRPFGRPKCESRMTLAPLSAISVIDGAMRSMRVASETTPFSTGTLRSTRTSTRLPFTSTWSRVRNFGIVGWPGAARTIALGRNDRASPP